MQSRRWVRPASLLGWLVVATVGFLVWDFSRFWGRFHHYHEQALAGIEQMTDKAEPHEVIVVLTGDIGRIPRALDLLQARGSDRLIISGAAKGVSLTDMIQHQGATLSNLAAIMDRITLESTSVSTIENARQTKRLLDGNPLSRLIIVTSDYHMGRSLKVFSHYFPAKILVPFSVPSSFVGNLSVHFMWKTGTEYWKSLFYRILRTLNVG